MVERWPHNQEVVDANPVGWWGFFLPVSALGDLSFIRATHRSASLDSLLIFLKAVLLELNRHKISNKLGS